MKHSQYQQIIKFIREAGQVLVAQAGKVKDIGIYKEFLTEQDLKIERGLKEIIESFYGDHCIYAEEENDKYLEAKNVWVADPISGTSTFIRGLPHYAIVVSHVYKGETLFAAIYDPSMDDLYTAFKGKGAFVNSSKMAVSKMDKTPRVMLNFSSAWQYNLKLKQELQLKLAGYNFFKTSNSVAVNYSYVAGGKYDAVITLSKDVFPEFAGSLVIREAGGKFTNIAGQERIQPSDRVFVGGNNEAYNVLFPIVQEVINEFI